MGASPMPVVSIVLFSLTIVAPRNEQRFHTSRSGKSTFTSFTRCSQKEFFGAPYCWLKADLCDFELAVSMSATELVAIERDFLSGALTQAVSCC